MNVLINILVYQICWFVCILGGANDLPMAGVLAAALALAYHLYTAARPGAALALVAFAAVVGGIWDSTLVAAGWLIYPSGTPIEGTAPYWIVAMWIAFATTFNVSLRWFKQHLLAASLFGAIGAPLAFLAGAKLGGVVFVDPLLGYGALAIGWAVLMPLMMIMARRWDGFDRSSVARPASALASGS